MLENDHNASSPGNSKPSLAFSGTGKIAQPARTPQPTVSADLSAGMLENNRLKRPKSVLDIFVSVFLHCLVLAAAILIPLYYSSALNFHPMEATYLVAPPPPPPPPPPPAPAKAIVPPRHFFTSKTLYQPRVIPKQVAQVKDAPPPQSAAAVPGGVIGGVPGWQVGGVLGGILGGLGHAAPPPPPKAVAQHGPYRVGGRVQPPKLVDEVQPTYPPLARDARVQGDVMIDSVIDTQGDVTKMNLVSGNPLLISAAFDAVKQWKYQPTLLNGVPVSVEMQVTVHFNLAS